MRHPTRPSSTEQADVVIIGGGPAGSAAAITAAQKGLSVIILETRSFPRDRPGETLHPGIEPLLTQLGVWPQLQTQKIVRHTGHWIETPHERHFEAFGSDPKGVWHGFQWPRYNLDLQLLKYAQTLGVQVLQPCHCNHAIVHDQRIVGLTTRQGNIYGQYIIDAAGGHHWLARKHTPQIQYYSCPLVAIYGYVSGDCHQLESHPRLIIDSQGWTWMAKVKPQTYQWTRVHLSARDRPIHPEIPVELRSLKPTGKIRQENVTWRKLDSAAGDGYFAIGDAAFVLDPGSSHGVLKAIMSGIMASHMISQILAQQTLEAIAVRAFRIWINRWFEQDLQHLTEFYEHWGWSPRSTHQPQLATILTAE